MVKPITIFISYAHKDAPYLEELQTFLKPYARNKSVSVWTDKDILPGDKWDQLIKKKLSESEIMLFLVSQDFIASDYINNIEIKNALESNRLIIIPIIVRPVEMSQLVLNSFQVLPSGAKPISKWDNKDDAWVDVIRALKTVFDKINGKNSEPSADTAAGQNKTSRPVVLNRVNSTDKLVVGFVLLLISISIVVFAIGLIIGSKFHVFVSFAGMGIGLAGYFFMRKFFPV